MMLKIPQIVSICLLISIFSSQIEAGLLNWPNSRSNKDKPKNQIVLEVPDDDKDVGQSDVYLKSQESLDDNGNQNVQEQKLLRKDGKNLFENESDVERELQMTYDGLCFDKCKNIVTDEERNSCLRECYSASFVKDLPPEKSDFGQRLDQNSSLNDFEFGSQVKPRNTGRVARVQNKVKKQNMNKKQRKRYNNLQKKQRNLRKRVQQLKARRQKLRRQKQKIPAGAKPYQKKQIQKQLKKLNKTIRKLQKEQKKVGRQMKRLTQKKKKQAKVQKRRRRKVSQKKKRSAGKGGRSYKPQAYIMPHKQAQASKYSSPCVTGCIIEACAYSCQAWSKEESDRYRGPAFQHTNSN